MCGRYILVQKIETIEKRFNVINSLNINWEPSYNISAGQMAPVITNKEPNKIQLFRFGMTPFWAKKDMLLINARSEGDSNKEDDTNYKGTKGIITKPAFRKPIRSQRCLIPADAFIEGTTAEKLNKPYLVYLKEKIRPFAFAGIWDEWESTKSGEIVQSFAIITTVSNSLLQKIPHHRSPVILPPWAEQKWLNSELPLTDITKYLEPYDGSKMNAYPIDPLIKSPRNNDKNLILPKGERLDKEEEIVVQRDIKLEGMGSSKRFGYNPDKPWN